MSRAKKTLVLAIQAGPLFAKLEVKIQMDPGFCMALSPGATDVQDLEILGK